MRKLASIKTISDIRPIEGKDRIVLASVDGWHVIVLKDEYEIGDACVYVEIDSILPEREEFEFLRSKGFRIKTMRMGDVISQGICFPLSILPPGNYEDGQDVTEILGVKQYEQTVDADPTPGNTSSKKQQKKYPKFLMRMSWFRKLVLPKEVDTSFPSFISKTDETRIQNMPFILDSNEPWVATEKVDGQSGTFALVRKRRFLPFLGDKFEFIVCSRNRKLPIKDNSFYWYVAEKYHIKDVLRSIIGACDWVAIQGECVGPGIQKNKYKLSEYDLYVFNLIYPDGRIDSIAAENTMAWHNMKFVPIVDRAIYLPSTVDEVLSYVHGDSRIAATLREGIVFRSMDGKKSFKVVDPLFLIQNDE